MRKTVKSSGADEKTPSRAQYFSWINNTNEGSTEEQTFVNLDYFGYLKRKYGMQLDIYAWDAGNLDGAKGTYETLDSPKIKAQYPHGYLPCVKKANEYGIRLGVWGGADGYGETPDEENARRELLVSLCRDYHFALFKFDRVCGGLRFKKRSAFKKTMKECRKYSPDLILLNHRNKLGLAEKFATTFLWQGKETYVDVLSHNQCTAPHHRAFAFTRGMVPQLKRLTEDHGVCLSSCLDYFEDELIIQAFGRSLILAPEIYGNPWLLRDDELPVLARIYNLHRKYRDILVNGILLPESYGKNAVSRGDDKRRFICVSNPTWTTKKITIRLGKEIGLKYAEKISVISRFPYEGLLGMYNYDETLMVDVLPFRSCLIEAVDTKEAETVLAGCLYTVLESNEGGEPFRINVVQTDGDIVKQRNFERYPITLEKRFDCTEKAPIFIGQMVDCAIPNNDRQLYETAMFAVNNDSFECQSLNRSGKTSIPEVERAREAFFNQNTYLYKGCNSSAMFDGNDDTFFDARSKTYMGGFRVDGGCLRVDLGEEYSLDEIVISYLEANNNETDSTLPQVYHDYAVYSANLKKWKATQEPIVTMERDVIIPVVVEKVNNIVMVDGTLRQARYKIPSKIRYFELPCPMDRIVSFEGFFGGEKVTFAEPKANNLMASYSKKTTKSCKKISFILNKNCRNKFLSIACEGKHGEEGVYCVAECDGNLYGCGDRSSSFPCNVWEHIYAMSDSFYTYYLPVDDKMIGKEITVYALFNKPKTDIPVRVYLCEKHLQAKGLELNVRLD